MHAVCIAQATLRIAHCMQAAYDRVQDTIVHALCVHALSPFLRDLRATYDDHLRLLRKLG